MTISVKCSCGKNYTLKDECAGKTATCNACGNKMKIPAPIAHAPTIAQTLPSQRKILPNTSATGGVLLKPVVEVIPEAGGDVLSAVVTSMRTCYCRVCGTEVMESAVLCMKCGCAPEDGRNFCPACGNQTNEAAQMCVACGTMLNVQKHLEFSAHVSKVTLILLTFFLGGLGVHKFYTKNLGWGLIYLVLCWTYIPAIIATVEFVRYLSLSEEIINEKLSTEYGKAWGFLW
jgi:TM2 domain-containing membrane protein YozV